MRLTRRFLDEEDAEAGEGRTPAARDRDRIIHSSAFRRLQGKSQIVGTSVADFFRTRLTHSVECAQIGRSIAQRVTADERVVNAVDDPSHLPDTVEAACLAHDLGHPPFGHNGEQALQGRMVSRAASLFEGNAQSFRIVSLLEPKRFMARKEAADRWVGLNLTRATLCALLKYPRKEGAADIDLLAANGHPKFCIYADALDEEYANWIWEGGTPERTLATEIMDVADDIAYATHDFEDGVWSRMIPFYELLSSNELVIEQLWSRVKGQDAAATGRAAFDDALQWLLSSSKLRYLRSIPYDNTRYARAELKNFASSLIGYFIEAVSLNGTFVKPSGEVAARLAVLKAMAWEWMIDRSDMATFHFGQQRIIRELFDGYWADPNMLPRRDEWDALRGQRRRQAYRVWRTAEGLSQERLWPEKARLICDHIAGMTDEYALRAHSQMYGGAQPRELRWAY